MYNMFQVQQSFQKRSRMIIHQYYTYIVFVLSEIISVYVSCEFNKILPVFILDVVYVNYARKFFFAIIIFSFKIIRELREWKKSVSFRQMRIGHASIYSSVIIIFLLL